MRVLIAEACDKILVENLQHNNYECFYEPTLNEKEILRKIPKYEGIIFRNKISSLELLTDKAQKLKFIAVLGQESPQLNTEYASMRGIKCYFANGNNHDAVSEHAIAMLLNLFNNMCRSNMQVKNGIWKRETNSGIEIANKTIGIIGYGMTGKAFAKRLSGFGVSTLAYDKNKSGYQDEFCHEASMEDLFEKCDVISLHIPINADNKYLVDHSFLRQFKKNIYLINTSHGQLIKTNDLANAVSKGKVLGAALDVLEFENSSFEKLHFGDMPESLQYLIDSDNVMFSPHIAGLTRESDYRAALQLSEKIIETFGPMNS